MKGILHNITRTSYSLLKSTSRYFAEGRFRLLFIFLILCIVTETEIKSQDNLSGYEDVSVLVQVDGYGSFFTDALYSPKGKLYISVEDLFKFFKIQCIAGQNGDKLQGFIENKNRPYEINYQAGEINVSNNVTDIKDGLIKQTGMLFMESSLFSRFFGIKLTFSFRSLSVAVKSDFELPVIKEQRLEKMRNNIRKNTGETVADKVLGRNYHLFRFGMLDWSVMSSQIWGKTTDTRLGLGLGAELLRGEANVFLNYSDKYKFDNRQQQYLWRWVNNDNRFVRQVQVGKISAQTISSVYYPVVGAVISNTPSAVRRAAGEYIINEVTQPDWYVELYINNVLIDFTRSDASGMFMFKVPRVYGFTTLTLRFYGPMGEERSETRTMNVPYSFLPAGEFEYRLSGGMLEDGKQTPFGRGEANFGVSRMLTIGAGAEYLASVTSGATIPFVTASFLPVNKLMIKGEYDHGVRIKGLLNYYLWSNTLLEIDYTKYDKGQHAILYNYLEERKANFSIPLKIKNIAGFARLGYKQNIYTTFNYNMAELLLSVYYKQFNTNLSTYANWVNDKSVNLNTMLALSYRMKNGLTIRPSAQVNISKSEIISYKAEVEKRFMHNGYLAASYENNAMTDYRSFNFSFKYDLSFAQTNASARIANKETITYQGARGSLAFGSGNKHIKASSLSSVGRGGISLIPFVDVNHNGILDKGEPMVGNLSVKINGGRVNYSKKDFIIRIVGLEPFISYNLELSDKDFDNIAWRIKNKNYKVLIDPNQFKTIEIPVVPVGEVSGMVYLKSDSTVKGIGRILVNFYNKSGVKLAETLSESDGYLNYLGLEPGKYIVQIDTVQLRITGMTSEPETMELNIIPGIDGDIVGGLDFTLKMKTGETISSESVTFEKPVAIKDNTYMIIHEATQDLATIKEDSYTIQIGAFKSETYAKDLAGNLGKLLGKDIEVTYKDGFYKVSIPGLKNQKEVDENISALRREGITEVFVIQMKAKQEKLALTEKQDTVSVIKETITVSPVPSYPFSIQLGAFVQESNAVAWRSKLSGMLDKEVIIVPEGIYFKVRVVDFTSLKEMKKYLPSLRQIGLTHIWILPVKKHKEIIPIIEEKPVVKEPSISLQIGVFQKRSQALIAKRKIISKLKLPVNIVEQWGYYKVIVTGFSTREETYKYYPELAGLGFSDISLIDMK
ncbi:MAG: SPOR domain-containing protein [Bacteroidota bacterium]